MSSSKVDKSSDTPDIGTGLPSEPPKGKWIDDDPNRFREQMPTTMMSRKTFSKAGKPAVIQLNSHVVEQWPTIDVAQFDVSLLQSYNFVSLTERHKGHYRQWR